MQKYLLAVIPKDVINYVLLKYYKYNFNGKVITIDSRIDVDDIVLYDPIYKIIKFSGGVTPSFYARQYIYNIIENTYREIENGNSPFWIYQINDTTIFVNGASKNTCNVIVFKNYLLNKYKCLPKTVEKNFIIDSPFHDIWAFDESYIYTYSITQIITMHPLDGNSKISFSTNITEEYFSHLLYVTNEYIYLCIQKYNRSTNDDKLYIF